MPLPIAPHASRSFWLLAALTWLLLVAALIHAGFQPHHWRLQQDDTLTYPAGEVAIFALLMLAETAVFGLIVHPWRFHRLWLRLLIGTLPWLGWSVLWGMAAMHQSPVRDVHLRWLLVTTLMMLMTLAVVVPPAICARLRRWLQK